MNNIEFSLNSYVNTYVNMVAVNYSELRSDLKSLLDKVEHDNELVVIKRSKGSGAVLMSIKEYNDLRLAIDVLQGELELARGRGIAME
ncbi:MAG: type II toxin-antitoxin system Phd/YefM family antitoxin [Cryomorphaceae bacterium]|jgi:prevent-host-death family protein|nr:type II toxin-antitoxin system Phd/YefM family antitoxin [Cryomorphaceae bacterium]